MDSAFAEVGWSSGSQGPPIRLPPEAKVYQADLDKQEADFIRKLEVAPSFIAPLAPAFRPAAVDGWDQRPALAPSQRDNKSMVDV